MPTKTYMVVDQRRDHSIRVPRPDLPRSVSASDACTQCHTDKPADWAARAIAGWYPRGRWTTPHFGSSLSAGRTGGPGAEQALDRLILDRTAPAIARGSALLLLPDLATPASMPAIQTAISDADPLVRAAAPRALPASMSREAAKLAAVLLADPVRAVRIEAARALAGVDPRLMTPEQRGALATANQELIAAEMVDAERPEAHLNLGLLNVRQQHPAEAETEYRTALRLDPTFVPAMVNLADLDRMRGRDEQGAEQLRNAMALEPDNPGVQYSLGLLLVRQHNYAAAIPLFRRASDLAPDNARYSYVYAIALNSTGSSAAAMTVLERAHRRNPDDRDVMVALVTIARDKGDIAAAVRYGHELTSRYPADAQFQAIVRDLENQQAR